MKNNKRVWNRPEQKETGKESRKRKKRQNKLKVRKRNKKIKIMRNY